MSAAINDILSDESELPLAGDLRQAVVGWLEHLRDGRGYSEATLVAYERDMRQFLGWLRGHLGHAPCLGDLAHIEAKGFRAFMAARRRAGLESRSLARTMSALRQFFRWLEAEGTVKNRAVLTLALPKVPHGIPKPLTVDKAASVVADSMEAKLDWIAARDLAVLLLLYGSGLRVSEALGLMRKDAPTPERDVLRIEGKGGKERLVPVLPITQEAIARYLAPVPLSSAAGRSPVSRSQGRAAVAAHHPVVDGGFARKSRLARDGDAACAAPFVRDASAAGRRRPAADPGAAGPREPVDDANLYGSRSRAAAAGL